MDEGILPDLKRFTDKAKYLLGEQLEARRNDEASLQEEIETLNEAIVADKREAEVLAGLFQVAESREKEAASGLSQDEQTKQKIVEASMRQCPFGDVLIGNCRHVLERQEAMNPTIGEAHALEQMEAGAAAQKAKTDEQLRERRRRIKDSEGQRKKLTKQQSELLREITRQESVKEDLEAVFKNLLAWKNRQESPESYTKLTKQVEELQNLRTQVEEKKAELARMLADHETNRDLLNSIFSAAAKRVLPTANYDGVVQLVNRELHFQITHGEAMTGEAVETLAVLLADISCLIYNAFSEQSFLPGFLLHDSPREADLGLRLYHGYFRLAAESAEEFRIRGGAPF